MAESYQLAQSKAEDIRIIIDGATAETWCQPQVHFRFQGGANATEEGLATLFSKLDKVFAKTCPKAESLSWEYRDVNEKVQLLGQTTKANAWAYKPERLGTQTAATQSSDSDTAKAQPANTTTSTTQTETSAVSTSQVTTTQPETAVPESTTQSSAATVQETATASANQNAQGVAKEAEAAPAVVPSTEVQRDYLPLGNFAVGSFKPPTEEERKKLLADFVTKEDQKGCKLFSQFNFGSQEQYAQFQTEGVLCDEKGFLNGSGVIRVKRTDGASIIDDTNITFNHGLVFAKPFTKISPESLAYVRKGSYGSDSDYLFSVGSDESLHSHYLLGTTLGFHYGLGFFSVEKAYVLVDNLEDFKQANKLKLRIDAAIAHFDQVLPSTEDDFELLFVDDLSKHFENQYGIDGKIYKVSLTRKMRWTKNGYVPAGPWVVRDYSVKNYVFEREAQIAREKAREEELKRQAERERRIKRAREQQQLLAVYEEIKQSGLNSVDKAQEYLYKNVRYDSNDYHDFLSGDSASITTIMHIDKVDDKYAVSDWPYEMKISATGKNSFKEGWYVVRGYQKLDFSQTDSDGLPLTMVTPANGGMYACQKEKCTDIQDPLVMMKILHGVSDWSPVEARKIIQEAEE